jgi:antitoxin MazE
MLVAIRPVGNSLCVILPRSLLAQAHLDQATGVDMTLEGDAIVLRKPAKPAREGWAAAASRIAGATPDQDAPSSAKE